MTLLLLLLLLSELLGSNCITPSGKSTCKTPNCSLSVRKQLTGHFLL